MSTKDKVRQLQKQHPTWGRYKIAQALGLHPTTVQPWIDQGLKKKGNVAVEVTTEPPPPAKTEDLVPLAHKLLLKGPVTPKTLCESLGVDLPQLDKVIEELSVQHNVVFSGGAIRVDAPPFGRLSVKALGGKEPNRAGLVADTHLACDEERLEALHTQYDLFEREGIKEVYHAGNIVDGYIPRINGASAKCTTVDDQIQYVIDNYPARKGITTHFITGDDHEGWFIQQGINFGCFLQHVANEQGRNDLHYIGHVEADVEYKTKVGSAIVKISHPGGGSSYARSYTGQKTVESFEGGEKPAILVQGHYHVSNFMQERNVYVISLPGFQDQTVFARKKRLRMEVGGAILEFWQSPNDGSVTRCRVEMNRYFDRGYYKPFLRSDSTIQKGHLVIHTDK